MSHFGSALYRNFRIYQVFGANTNVGKTIFSTLLCRAAKTSRQASSVWYLKPVSTGPFDDADKWHLDRFARGVATQDFYQFDEAVSPHVAAAKHKISDSMVLEKIANQIRVNAQEGPGFMLVETAGGPHSPGPSGTSQADLFRPLRIPALFIADWRLGGISTSISSFEALRMRGYDIEGVAVFKDTKFQNYEYFQKYFRDHDVPFLTVPLPPHLSESHDHSSMSNFYLNAEAVMTDGTSVKDFASLLEERHNYRVERLETMGSSAFKRIWWPFTQHQSLNEGSLNIIDSAHEDYFQTLSSEGKAQAGTVPKGAGSNMLQSTFDGSASWWTQGLGHANSALTAAAAHAAGRYGHVMFAEGVHEPALALAEKLLAILGNSRLERVFYSDNGSSGMEVAQKMALKASCTRYNWDQAGEDVEILGLQGSYHGDTLGAMDLSEPSAYNQKVPWYKGRGFWFNPPTVKMRKGAWVIEKPGSLVDHLGANTEFSSLASVFDGARDLTEEAASYERYIRSTIENLTQTQQRKFGALIMEPVVLGAGGMTLVDPLFQRILARVVRSSAKLFSPSTQTPRFDSPESVEWSGLPIVFDEVFTGLYRLGHRTAASLLHVEPDISVHAKLLTGGLVPLAATVASESIYEAALSPSKVDALLHGHSYTAHPVGCSVANTSLRLLSAQDEDGKWDAFKLDWARGKSMGSELLGAVKEAVRSAAPGTSAASQDPSPPIWSNWSMSFVSALSHATDKVDGVWALGSILSIQLRDEQGGGYTSNVARGLQQKLLKDEGATGWNIHSRVLGNVLYLMTSQVSEEEDVRRVERRVRQTMGV